MLEILKLCISAITQRSEISQPDALPATIFISSIFNKAPSLIIRFNVLGVIRKVNEWSFKKYTRRKSIPGTIYGDIQRKNKKD